MIELTALTETGLNLNSAVELRKTAAELGIKGASKGRKADLIAAIMELVDTAKAEKELEEEAKAAQEALAEEVPAPARKKGICIDCGKRRISKYILGPELCDICYDYGGWENTHSDENHEAVLDSTSEETENMKECPVCHSELDKRYVFKAGRSRAGMVIVAKGTEVHKSATFKTAAEAAGWTVKVMDTFEAVEGNEARYVAIATRGNDTIELSWNGRAYDYPNSGATIKGKARKVRNLKEALRILL
jgi:rubrerythrin